MPLLHILAGPNGAGKTTFYETALAEKFIGSSLPFINVDLITRSLGGYTSENFVRADAIARQEIAKHINGGLDFMIESNLATQKDYDWIEAMVAKGYEIILYFLCTQNIQINIGRVQKRVAEGGHNVATPIIEQRYRNGLTYLKGKLHKFGKAYLIDNSSETAIVIAEIENGVIKRKSSSCPAWVTDLLFIIERLSRK